MWGYGVPEGVKTSWGARAIYDIEPSENRDPYFSLLHDRQTGSGEKKKREVLSKWVNEVGFQLLDDQLKKQNVQKSDAIVITVSEGDYTLVASPNASYGYLYISAYPTSEVENEPAAKQTS